MRGGKIVIAKIERSQKLLFEIVNFDLIFSLSHTKHKKVTAKVSVVCNFSLHRPAVRHERRQLIGQTVG